MMGKKSKEDDVVKEKDEGMKWVIFADILGAIVIGLLVWASMIKEETTDVQSVSQSNNVSVQVADFPNYDFDMRLADQDCTNVEGLVNAVLITDANYMDFTRVAINSAKQTKCPNSVYHFYVMTVDVSQADVAALKDLESENVSVSVLPQKEVDLFYVRDTHVSKASLLKYYIARAVPELDKILYLDSDILVLHDLTPLYRVDIDDVYLAAVKDPSWFFENTHVLELNLAERGFYFNSGVMLMNLKKFREDGLEKKLEDFTNNNFRTYMDQDALNVIVGNSVKLLDFENNAMNFFFEHIDMATLGRFYGREWKTYEDVFSPATIIHFASSKKPLGPTADQRQFFRMLQRLWYKYYKDLPPLQ